MTDLHSSVAEPEAQRSLGNRLRLLREEQGLSLDDVSLATRVSLGNLRAIEAETYDRLPADSFAKGMVALYATHLGLDGPQAAAQFLEERYHGRDGQSSAHQNLAGFSLLPKRLAEPPHVSSATVAMALLLVIVLTILVAVGIKESMRVNLVLVAIKLFVVLFVIIAGIGFINAANYSPFIPPAKAASASGVAPRGRVPAIGWLVTTPSSRRTSSSGDAPTI